MLPEIGDTFTARRGGMTAEFTITHITKTGWLRCVSERFTRANGSSVKFRQFATFKKEGQNYTTRRRSSPAWEPYWLAQIDGEEKSDDQR